jgi:hypothetical protein
VLAVLLYMFSERYFVPAANVHAVCLMIVRNCFILFAWWYLCRL